MALTDLWVIGEQGLGGIVTLSIAVSVAAAALAGVLGTALGAALAVYRIPGRRIIVMALHALLACRRLSSVSPCTCCYRAPGHLAHWACCLRRRQWY